MRSLIDEAIKQMNNLPTQQQQEVLNFIEFLTAKANAAPANKDFGEPIPSKPRISREETIKRYAGCLSGGPSDLSTNKAYMEGFGEV